MANVGSIGDSGYSVLISDVECIMGHSLASVGYILRSVTLTCTFYFFLSFVEGESPMKFAFSSFADDHRK